MWPWLVVLFTDADKQMAINVFLGVYQPGEGIPDIWDLTTDYYLHHTMARVLPSAHSIPNHTKWWESELIDTLPLPLYRGGWVRGGVSPGPSYTDVGMAWPLNVGSDILCPSHGSFSLRIR